MCTIKSSGLFLFFLYSFIEGIEGLDWVALESWLYQSPAEKRADRQCRRWVDGGRGSGVKRQGGLGEGREREEGWPDERRVRHTDRCCWRIRKMYWDILRCNSFGIYVALCNLSVDGDKQLFPANLCHNANSWNSNHKMTSEINQSKSANQSREVWMSLCLHSRVF